MKLQKEENTAREERAAFLAEKIIQNAKAELLMHLPYFAEVVAHLQTCDSAELLNGGAAERPVRFGTDGRTLYYDPWHVLRITKAEEYGIVRDLMHVFLHCLFRHPFCDERTALPGNREWWDLACDLAVESIINELKIPAFSAPREKEQHAMTVLIRSEIGEPLSAERIYRWLRDRAEQGMLTAEERDRERLKFLGDQHRLWYTASNGSELFAGPEPEEWNELARKTELLAEEMEEDPADPVLQGLKGIRRRRISYAEVLRRFLSRGELLETSDEFDYIYYTYGLSLYGNIPLIEQLEYKEDDRIRTLVIAVDTSGSVQGKTVQTFIEHTCSLIFDETLISERMRIHILQCDDRIREERLIESREDLRQYMPDFQAKGLGQTDFRPVFAYVGRLLEAGALKDFQGLIYFTDGDGIFPAEAPAYDTMFLLSREGMQVPSWAARYELGEEMQYVT